MENAIVDLWKQRSATISATVHEADSVEDAFSFILDLCQSSEPHEVLLKNDTHTEKKTIAAPDLPAEQAAMLRKGCEERGFAFVESGLRDYASGFEIGVAWAAAALADTGSCVIKSTNEEVRLATMLPETSVLLIPRSKILAGSRDAAPLLRECLNADTPSYMAYVSGPSRTADIERVLTLGVHGPLKLYAVLINDAS